MSNTTAAPRPTVQRKQRPIARMSPRDLLAREQRDLVEVKHQLWADAVREAQGVEVDAASVVARLKRSGISIDRYEEWVRDAKHRLHLAAMAADRAPAEAAIAEAKAQKVAAEQRAAQLKSEAEEIVKASYGPLFDAEERLKKVKAAEAALAKCVPPELSRDRDEARVLEHRSAAEAGAQRRQVEVLVKDLDDYRAGVDRLRGEGWDADRLREHEGAVKTRETQLAQERAKLVKLEARHREDAEALERLEAELARVLRGELADGAPEDGDGGE